MAVTSESIQPLLDDQVIETLNGLVLNYMPYKRPEERAQVVGNLFGQFAHIPPEDLREAVTLLMRRETMMPNLAQIYAAIGEVIREPDPRLTARRQALTRACCLDPLAWQTLAEELAAAGMPHQAESARARAEAFRDLPIPATGFDADAYPDIFGAPVDAEIEF